MKIVAETVLAFVFRKKPLRFLLMKRTPDRGGFWQSVSGKVKKKESAEDAALREAEEETGLKPRRLLSLDYINAFYELGAVRLEPCFGVEVGPGRVKLSHEHTEYRWLDAKGALRLMRWPGNRAGLAVLIDELRGNALSSS